MNEVQDEIAASAAQFMQAESDAVSRAARSVGEEFSLLAVELLGVRGKVVFTGAGTSGHLGRRAAHLFSVCGTPAFFLQPTDGLHGSLGALAGGDVVVALSKGGTSVEVNELVRRAKTESIRVIAVTARLDSELAGLADRSVVIPADDISDPGGLIAMGSTLAQGAWLDAMAYVLMRLRGYGWDRVLFTHPGGAVGKTASLPDPLEPLSASGPSEVA